MGSIVRWLLVLVVVGIVGFFGWRSWSQKQASSNLPGIASGNGRLEAIQVDIAAKYAGRVGEITVHEGDMVEPGQVLVRMDLSELDAELAKAKAKVAESEESAAEVTAEIIKKESELKYAKQQLERAEKLIVNKTISREEYDSTKTQQQIADAGVNAVKARLRSVNQNIEAAAAEQKRVQSQIDNSILKSPVRGRVLYRLAEEGEVLAAGGKALTLINLGDIYMEIFLPAEEAAKVRLHSDARITLDAAPGYAGVAKVTFISPEAQFTPKQVETKSERDKLMFKVKLQVPPEVVLPYLDRIKTGMRGMGYVRLDESIPWPASLEKRFPRPPVATPEEKPPAEAKPKESSLRAVPVNSPSSASHFAA